MSIINEIIALLESETEISPAQFASFEEFIQSSPSFDPYDIFEEPIQEDEEATTFARLLFEAAICGQDGALPLLEILAEKKLLKPEDKRALKDINYHHANILLSQSEIEPEEIEILKKIFQSELPPHPYITPDSEVFGAEYNTTASLASSLLQAYNRGNKQVWELLDLLITKAVLTPNDTKNAENIFNRYLVKQYCEQDGRIIDLETLYKVFTNSLQLHMPQSNPISIIEHLNPKQIQKACKLIRALGVTYDGRTLLNGLIPGDEDQKMLLHVAALVNHDNGHKLVTALLAAGAVPDITAIGTSRAYGEQHGKEANPLHNAVSAGNLTTVRALLEAGANPLLKNGYGETPGDLLFCEAIKDPRLFSKIERSGNRKDLEAIFLRLTAVSSSPLVSKETTV